MTGSTTPADAVHASDEMEGYLVIIEKGEESFGAYAPDLPGCAAVGDTEEEVRQLIREAIPFHLEGMREAGEPIPPPTSGAMRVPVAA